MGGVGDVNIDLSAAMGSSLHWTPPLSKQDLKKSMLNCRSTLELLETEWEDRQNSSEDDLSREIQISIKLTAAKLKDGSHNFDHGLLSETFFEDDSQYYLLPVLACRLGISRLGTRAARNVQPNREEHRGSAYQNTCKAPKMVGKRKGWTTVSSASGKGRLIRPSKRG